MLPQSFIVSGYSANVANEEIEQGIVDALFLTFSNITAVSPDTTASMAQRILNGMTINAVRKHADGTTTEVIDGDVPLSFFRSYLNLHQGYVTADQGVIIYLGRHTLGNGEKLSVSLDWTGVDASGLAVGSDLSTTVITMYHAEALSSQGEPVMFYAALEQVKETTDHAVEVPNMVNAYYLGADLVSVRPDIPGANREIPAAVIALESAAQYRHEDESTAALSIIYDADAFAAQNVSPRLKVKTSGVGSHIVQVGVAL